MEPGGLWGALAGITAVVFLAAPAFHTGVMLVGGRVRGGVAVLEEGPELPERMEVTLKLVGPGSAE